jgi:hypothetical protein
MHLRICSFTQNGSFVSRLQAWRRRCSIPKGTAAATNPSHWQGLESPRGESRTGLDVGETSSRPRVLLHFQRAHPRRRTVGGRCCRGGKHALEGCVCAAFRVFARVGSCKCAPMCVGLCGRVCARAESASMCGVRCCACDWVARAYDDALCESAILRARMRACLHLLFAGVYSDTYVCVPNYV